MQPDGGSLGRRRALVAALVAATTLLGAAALALLLAADGVSPLDPLVVLCFAATLPWGALNLWNAVIGLALMLRPGDPLALVAPGLAAVDGRAPLRGRTALVMPVHEEDPVLVVAHLSAALASLEAEAPGADVAAFLLSDTQDRATARGEAAAVAAWRRDAARPERIHYRRRRRPAGAKTGNLWDWLEGPGAGFDYAVVLDADSVMDGAVLARLVRSLDADPSLGILQTLITGLPTAAAFPRLFQYGMRHGMRSYSLGGAWWQGPDGPYWGHNAILRVAAFRGHCRLPELPGGPPLGGRLLSHDQVEAVLMRRGGFTVRVLPVELGSHEAMPPTLPDFIRRDLRWCQGNLQYPRLLGLPGLAPVGRVQLGLAILMYVQGPAWLLALALGALQAAVGGPALPGSAVAVPPGLAPGLLAASLFLIFAPKLAGVVQTLVQPGPRRRFGGAWRVLASSLVELGFGMLLAPVMAAMQARFLVSLAAGRGVGWTAQLRSARTVSAGEAGAALWPAVAAGLGLLALGLAAGRGTLPWLTPVLAGLLGAPLLAWLTARPELGAWLTRHGLAAIPEELALQSAAAGQAIRNAKPIATPVD